MKKLILTLLIFCVSASIALGGMILQKFSSAAGQVEVLALQTFEASGSGCGCGLDPPPDDDIYDEVDHTLDGWISSDDNLVYISATLAHGGTQSLFIDIDAQMGRGAEVGYTAQSGDHWFDFEIACTDCSGNSGRFGIADGTFKVSTDIAIYLKIDGNDIDSYNGSSWVECCANCIPTDNTFYHIQIKVMPNTDTFDLYVDDSLKCSSVAFRNNVAAPDQIFLNTHGTVGDDLYFDAGEVYTGDRK